MTAQQIELRSEEAPRNEVAPRQETAPAPAQSETAAVLSLIERAARDPNVDIDKMERLFQMQERAVARAIRASFDAAFAAMQPYLPIIDEKGLIEVREKDARGNRTGAVQQSTSYALWADINDAIKPALTKHGFALSFRTGMAADGRVTVTGILSHREGHREETTMTLPHDSTGSKNAVQAIGSSTSYGKRYTAMSLLNITSRAPTERDDDGHAAGAPMAISDEQLADLRDLIEAVGAREKAFAKFMKVESLPDLPAGRYAEAVAELKAFGAKNGVRT